MRIKLQKFLIMLILILLTPVAMAHSGVHGADGLLVAILHQLSAADHWLIFFVLFLFAGLFISAIRRRSIVKK